MTENRFWTVKCEDMGAPYYYNYMHVAPRMFSVGESKFIAFS